MAYGLKASSCNPLTLVLPQIQSTLIAVVQYNET